MSSAFRGVVPGVNLLRNALVGLGGVLSARAVLGYAEAYTRVQNNLRVAGVASEEMADATREVFDIANRTRTPIERR